VHRLGRENVTVSSPGRHRPFSYACGFKATVEARGHIFGDTLSLGTGVFLLLALGLALSFEFVNGFHDTANAVATVIYTHTLTPTVAVVWSGIWNLIGVLTSTGESQFAQVTLDS
jgi:hypothetical protein